MSKLKAEVIPFSSAGGTGIMLLNEEGVCVAQLSLMNAVVARTPEEMTELAEYLGRAIGQGQPERRIHHPKRGHDYDVVAGEALFQVSDARWGAGSKGRVIHDGDPVTVYRNEHGTFVRFPDEIVEPRFQEIKP